MDLFNMKVKRVKQILFYLTRIFKIMDDTKATTEDLEAQRFTIFDAEKNEPVSIIIEDIISISPANDYCKKSDNFICSIVETRDKTYKSTANVFEIVYNLWKEANYFTRQYLSKCYLSIENIIKEKEEDKNLPDYLLLDSSILEPGSNSKLNKRACDILDKMLNPPKIDPDIIRKQQENNKGLFSNSNTSKFNDLVDHPSHYTYLKGIEVIDICRQLDFDLGNAIKYILRAGHKSEKGYTNKEKTVQDLEKAIWYINDKINSIMNGND